MDVSRSQFKSQVYTDSAAGKSPEKEDKAKALDIGFSEKIAQPKKAVSLAGKVEKAPASVACSNSCGCGNIAREPASFACSNSCGCY